MESFSQAFEAWLMKTVLTVVRSLGHNWPILVVGILIAAAMRAFISQDRLVGFFRRRSGQSILLAVAVAVLTPLCSCGTMAIILAMMTSVVPWGPIVAFMVASPLSSPAGFVYLSAFLGLPFAAFHFVAAAALGLSAGFVAVYLERRGYLKDQARIRVPTPVSQYTAVAASPSAASCDCQGTAQPAVSRAGQAGQDCAGQGGVATAAQRSGTSPAGAFARQLLVMAPRIFLAWLAFATVGYGITNLLPVGIVDRLMGSQNAWSVPVAALLGLPLYVNADASLPLLKSLVEAGMSPGAAMAFMISGPATCIGAIAGALTIAKSRVVGLVVAAILFGALAFGWLFEVVARLL